MYERFGQGYRGLTRFLWEVARGYAFKTELWRRYGHLLDAPDTPLVVDGVRHARYTAVVATTVPLELAKGAVGTIHRTAEPGTMNVVGVLSTDKGAVIRAIPRLLVGAPTSGVTYVHGAREVLVHGGYTLDGERVDALDGNHAAPLRVRGSRHVVQGIWLQ